jgi:hypothetical protein
MFTRQRFVDLGPFSAQNTARALESRGKDVRLTVVGGIIATPVIKNRSATSASISTETNTVSKTSHITSHDERSKQR